MRLRPCLLLFCTLSLLSGTFVHALAADTPPATEPSALSQRADLPSRSSRQEAALRRELDKEQFRQLEAGDDNFLGLFLPAARPAPLGGVLLVADRGEHADAPRLIAASRRHLSDAGWHTLSISLPDRLGNLDHLSDAEQEIARQAHAEQIRQRLRQAWLALQAEGAEQVALLGQGEAAWWVLRTAGQDSNDPALGKVVLLDPRPWPAGEPLHRLLEAWDRPLLEIHSRDEPDPEQLRRREREIRRLGRSHNYDQVQHPLLPGQSETSLNRRIEGWLRK
ncbi:DUF3530 family protein [Halopseudomonas salegens]|uniref:DUF3530 family protein n=1 Tax=Halopseudomonas salegens TaxID=1434072 RepID=A0A1H2DXI6_9GAMM|nr:DUF3530 family protein [Halopseudomonas salegens]SDT87489.1 Protein of unknown function [Halopseudomonas salegens]